MPGSCLYISVMVLLLALKSVVSSRPNIDAAAYGLLLEYCTNEYFRLRAFSVEARSALLVESSACGSCVVAP
ncbi:hypothetical protein D3C81_1641660 [compost metagenome]